MKRLLLLAIVLKLCPALNSQNLRTDSINYVGKAGWELPSDVVFDTSGNYYVAGSFENEITIGNQLVKSNGKRDIFLAKYNQSNQVQWAKNFGGLGDDNAYSLLYSNNQLYLAGCFKGKIGFNNGSINLQGQGLTDVFLAQINSDGSVGWARPIISPEPAQKAFLQVDPTGNIWLSGSFSKTINVFGATINSGDAKGVYLAYYNLQGYLRGSVYFTSDKEIELKNFLIDSLGQFYCAGAFSGKISTSGKNITSNGKTDGFIAKFNKNISLLWLNNIGGQYDDEIKSIAIDAQNNIYAAGEFRYQINLLEPHVASQNTDVFIVKYDQDGKMLWSKQLGADGSSMNTVSSLKMAGNGRFFLSGNFRGTIQKSPELKSTGNASNSYLARFQTDGKKDWIIGASSLSENNFSINFNKLKNGIFFYGYFSNDFKLQNYEIKNRNYKDAIYGTLLDCDLLPKVNLGPDHSFCNLDTLKTAGTFKSYSWSNSQTTPKINVTQGGTFVLQATDKWGCVSSDTITVALLPQQTIDLGPNASICQGSKMVLNTGYANLPWIWNDGSTGSQLTVNKSGTYKVRLNGTACPVADSINISTKPSPVVNLGPDIVAAPTQTITLDAGAGQSAYLWTNNGTTQKLTIAMSSVTAPTYFWVKVTSANGCTGSDTILVSQTGMALPAIKSAENANDSAGTNSFVVYPNPSQGMFYIRFTDPEKVKQIDVFDIPGNFIKTYKNVTQQLFELDLTGHAKGSYFIKISEDKLVRKFKVVLE